MAGRRFEKVDEVWAAMEALCQKCGFTEMEFQTRGMLPGERRRAEIRAPGEEEGQGGEGRRRPSSYVIKLRGLVDTHAFVETKFGYPASLGIHGPQVLDAMQVLTNALTAVIRRQNGVCREAKAATWVRTEPLVKIALDGPDPRPNATPPPINPPQPRAASPAPQAGRPRTVGAWGDRPRGTATPQTARARVETVKAGIAQAQANQKGPIGAWVDRDSPATRGRGPMRLAGLDPARQRELLDQLWTHFVALCKQNGFVGSAWQSHGLEPVDSRKEMLWDDRSPSRRVFKSSLAISPLSFLNLKFICSSGPDRLEIGEVHDLTREITQQLRQVMRKSRPAPE